MTTLLAVFAVICAGLILGELIDRHLGAHDCWECGNQTRARSKDGRCLDCLIRDPYH